LTPRFQEKAQSRKADPREADPPP